VKSKSISLVSSDPMDRARGKQRSAAPANESQLAASFAHEINNPLQSLTNLLHLMAEEEATLSGEVRHYLTLAREEAGRISQIAHAVMNGFGNAARREEANVPEILDSVLRFYRSRFESQGILVTAHYCCPHGNLSVYANALRQMFSNLLLNAADAMPSGGKIHTKISKVHEWTGEQRLGLRVTFGDDGSGIATDDLQKILEPFFTTKGASGNGIGLSLVRETVQKHDGALRVRSCTKPGRNGSVFSIFLPASDPKRLTRPGRAA
jgi:two-component system, chemotaxis family, CheB/CheR fusion protein